MKLTESNPGNPLRFYQCSNPNCALRFPAPTQLQEGSIVCPRCKSPVHRIPLQSEVAAQIPARTDPLSEMHLEVYLDNIRSTFNVGAMLRTSDGAGVQHVHLGGITPQPGNPRIAKVSLGAEFSIPWTYHSNGLMAVKECKSRGLRILSLEIHPAAVSIFDLPSDTLSHPTLLVVGNEVSGIDPGILEISDQRVWIPMQGYKRSLNVAVAFGIAVYTLRFGTKSITEPPVSQPVNALQ